MPGLFCSFLQSTCLQSTKDLNTGSWLSIIFSLGLNLSLGLQFQTFELLTVVQEPWSQPEHLVDQLGGCDVSRVVSKSCDSLRFDFKMIVITWQVVQVVSQVLPLLVGEHAWGGSCLTSFHWSSPSWYFLSLWSNPGQISVGWCLWDLIKWEKLDSFKVVMSVSVFLLMLVLMLTLILMINLHLLYCLCTPSNGSRLGKMIKGDWRLQCQSPWHHGPWETGWLFFLQQSISFFDFEFFCPSSNSGRIFQVYLCAETHNQDFLLDCAQLCSQNVFDDCAVQTSTWWLPFLISVSLCVKRLTQSS